MPEKWNKPIISRKYAVGRARLRKLYFDRREGKVFFRKFIQDYFVGPARTNLARTGISPAKIGRANYEKIINAYRSLGRNYIEFVSGKTGVKEHALFSAGSSREILEALREGGVPQAKRFEFLKMHNGLLVTLLADQQLLTVKAANSNQ
ncbi:MAG: hypothetical protein HY544_05075 [Candidatus Diapherotrites archaeon]|uniref:Uncharacterized protein n=1 Tax=Candidatus Iainarchaeum sp. TaxID=3101447 RepID=A0A8T3YMA8_9ARCH|nr:hypothetical protein [Candidatus Diapherotrites archaeon]